MTDATFGFRAVRGHTGPNCQVEGYIPATDGTATFIGDAVKMTDTRVAGQQGPAVIQATTPGDPIFGVIERFLPNYDTLSGTGWNYRTASTLRRCLITLALPQIIWEIQADAALPLNDVGSHFDVVVGAGDTTTGMSGMELDVGTEGSTGQLVIYGGSNVVGEEAFDTAAAGTNCLVMIVESVWTGTATGL